MLKDFFGRNRNQQIKPLESGFVPTKASEAISISEFLAQKIVQPPHTTKYRVLQGMERTSVGIAANGLLFQSDRGEWSINRSGALMVAPHETVTSGVFRNSFYYGSWAEYTKVHRIYLKVDARGKFRLRAFVAASGRTPECLLTVNINNKKRQTTYLNLPDLDTLVRHGRLFWDCTSEDDVVAVHDIAYVTDEPPVAEKTTLFLGRTFGRTKDLVRVVNNFTQQRLTDDHVRTLCSAKFLLLDTSSANLSEYEELSNSKLLNLYACSGENLGGGGNAAQVLNLFLQQEQTVRETIDNVVIFDDDLDITIESLSRYRSLSNYMTRDVIVTLPVMMKSHPTTVWEDGGFWGRFHESGGSLSERTELFPQLIKHGTRLDRFDHLDDFCELNHPEYSTFIFFAMPRSVAERLRYPAPFFLRGDDIEYSLRAGKQNISILSNPNLCAWHEPAHSYGQEYMAILHGLIINLTYGTSDKDVFLRFFNDRFRSHGGIRDGLGIQVYSEVLKSLVRPTSVAERGFERHYLEKLSFFKAIDNRFESVDRGILHNFLSKDSNNTRYLLPFVYMKSENITSGTYVLQNHHQGTYFFRDLSDVTLDQEFYVAAAEFAQLLSEFLEKFDSIAQQFRDKLAYGISEEFWTAQLGPLKDRRLHGFAEFRVLSQPSEVYRGVESLRENPRSAGKRRKSTGPKEVPTDFDPDSYLRLNPDVQSANVPAVQHYLEFGWAEGRRWR